MGDTQTMTTRQIKIVLALLFVAIFLFAGMSVYLYLTIDHSGWQERNGQYYYLDSSGRPVTGWLSQDGVNYYFDSSGVMARGWQKIGGEFYCFSDGGAMQTGWIDRVTQRLYLDYDGHPVTGWQTVEGLRRYFLSDGALAVGWQTVDGTRRYFTEEGITGSGWLTTDEGTWYLNGTGAPTGGICVIDGDTYYFYNGSGMMHTGWLDVDDDRYYFGEDGRMATGWRTVDGKKCSFGEDGRMITGWMEDGEYRYYLLPEGGMADCPTVIDGETCFFTPDGIYVLLVNYQYPVPDGYRVDLVRYGEWARVAAVAENHLRRMILDCRATGIDCWLNCGYRTFDEQTAILENRTQEYQDQGMDFASARARALETVAVPGYSEHQTGLAFDIVCSVNPDWLHEHCWEYGFILRYPEDKSEITNISYEHWHYRYVGTKVSMAMKGTGLCLEEFLGAA